MATLLIRKLDDRLKVRLRERAASHGRSMEEEARAILRDTLSETPSPTAADLIASIRAKFAPLGGVDLELPSRKSMWQPPRFEE